MTALLAADPSAALKVSPGTPIADRVKAQLARDYPPGALDWVMEIPWSGPTRVPMDQIDRNAGDWSAAGDKRKVNAFATRISAGWRKPVVAIRRPGQRLLLLIDGHTRAAASAQIGQPVTAWIGTAPAAHGPWEQTHARQLSNGQAALEMSAAGYPAGVVGKRSGMISLDLAPGTVKPVPGGVESHHVTVVFLGDDVDDQAFAKACARAKAAAASAGGPLTGTVRGVKTFPPSDSSDGKRPAYAPVTIPGAQAIRAQLEDLSASEHGFSPHVTLSYVGKDDPLPPPVPSTAVKFTHLSVHRGDDVKRFPLGGSGSSHANEGEAINLSAQTARLAVTQAPAGKPGGPGLWRVRGMALPPYFQQIRDALEREGKTPEEAYRLTWGAIRRWARGGGKAHPEVVAAAQAALADLAAKSARAHAHANDREALELAWDAALHPRVGAGASAGGQFTKGQQGQQQSPARKPGKHRGHHLSGQRAARARQLRAQAATFREHAAQLRTQARALEGLIHAAEAKQKAAKRAAARSAAAGASGKQGARKVAARTSTKTHRRKTARRHGPSLPSMRLKAFELRSQARTLDAAARKLDGQARRL